MFWPIVQIFELDLLERFQWFEIASKLIRMTLESSQVQTNGEKPNSGIIPFFPPIHMGPIYQTLTQAPTLSQNGWTLSSNLF